MSNVVDINLANAYKQVRDATVCNTDISLSEKIGVLELVKAELMKDALEQMKDVL